MDRSSLIVVVMPITTMVALFTGIAVPFIAARRPGGRKARPPEPGADDATPAGYLYVPCARHPRDAYPAQGRRWVQEVPIVKRTAKLIYYTSDSWDRREAVVSPGCISREHFETDTRCHDHCPRDIAVGLVCAPHGRGHRHCVHVLAPGRHCHALANRRRNEERHGRETGRIVMNPQGGYTEIREPVHRAAPPNADPPRPAAARPSLERGPMSWTGRA